MARATPPNVAKSAKPSLSVSFMYGLPFQRLRRTCALVQPARLRLGLIGEPAQSQRCVVVVSIGRAV